MKNYSKIIFLIVIFLSLTSCGESNFNMTINSSKSMQLEHTFLLNDENGDTMLSILELDGVGTNKEIKYEEVREKKKSGIKVTAQIPNIDKYSSKKDVKVDLLRYGSIINDKEQLFKKTTHLFYTRYDANFEVDTSSYRTVYKKIMKILLPEEELEIEEDQNIKDAEPDYYEENGKENPIENASLVFVINVPHVIESNATGVNGNALTWVLKGGNVSEINFSFKIINPSTSLIFSTIVIIAGVFGLLYYKKKRLMKIIDSTSVIDSLELDIPIEEKRKYNPFSEGGTTIVYPDMNNFSGMATAISPYDNTKTVDQLIDEYEEDFSEKEIVPLNDIKEPDFKMINEGKMTSLSDMKEVFRSKIDAEAIANNDEYDPLNEYMNRKELQEKVEKKILKQLGGETEKKPAPQQTKSFISPGTVKTPNTEVPKAPSRFVNEDKTPVTIQPVAPKKSFIIDVPNAVDVKESKNKPAVQNIETLDLFADTPQEEPKQKSLKEQMLESGMAIKTESTTANSTKVETKPKENKFIS